MYKDGIPIYSYETAIGLCRSGQWFGGYVIGVNPNDVNEIAYMYKEMRFGLEQRHQERSY